jgi:hypothetical protein
VGTLGSQISFSQGELTSIIEGDNQFENRTNGSHLGEN